MKQLNNTERKKNVKKYICNYNESFLILKISYNIKHIYTYAQVGINSTTVLCMKVVKHPIYFLIMF